MVAELEARHRKSKAYNALPDDIEMLKAKIERLAEHTCLPEDPSPKEWSLRSILYLIPVFIVLRTKNLKI